MAIRVAVVDPLPMFVRGLMATLSTEGVDPEAPEDLITWAAGKDRPAVLLTVLTPREWTLLAEVLRARSDAVVVALLDTPDLTTYLRAIGAGAVGVLPRDAAPSLVRFAFRAAARIRFASRSPVSYPVSNSSDSPDGATTSVAAPPSTSIQ